MSAQDNPLPFQALPIDAPPLPKPDTPGTSSADSKGKARLDPRATSELDQRRVSEITIVPPDDEDGADDNDDDDELADSDGDGDSPNGKIRWSSKLTWKLVTAIRDNPTIRKEIYLPFGTTATRYKSPHYAVLARLVFSDHPTYGSRYRAYKKETRIKKNKFIQSVKNKLLKLRLVCDGYTRQLGETAKAAQCIDDIAQLPSPQDRQMLKKILSEFPWFFELREILASSAGPKDVPSTIGAPGSSSGIVKPHLDGATSVDPESESGSESEGDESRIEQKLPPLPIRDETDEIDDPFLSRPQSPVASGPISPDSPAVLTPFSHNSIHPPVATTERQSLPSTPATPGPDFDLKVVNPGDEGNDPEEGDGVADYMMARQKVQLAELSLRRTEMDAKVKIKLAQLQYRGTKRKLESREKVKTMRLQIKSKLKEMELQNKRLKLELEMKKIEVMKPGRS